MTTRCPGPQDATASDEWHLTDDAVRLTCEGTAREYHLSPAHPHLFCGCGSEASDCHPGRCCTDDDWGQCANCGLRIPRIVCSLHTDWDGDPDAPTA